MHAQGNSELLFPKIHFCYDYGTNNGGGCDGDKGCYFTTSNEKGVILG